MLSLFFIVRREKFDLINLHYVRENALYALILSHFKKLPLITSIHGEDIGTFPLEGKLNHWIVKQALKRAAQIVSNSSAFLKMTSKMFGEEILKKSVVLGNGVDLSIIDYSENNTNSFPTFILGIGRFIPKKGFDILIKAFALVKNRFPDLKLFLVGDGPERSRLEAICGDLGLKESVLFCGLMENKDVPKILMSCEFFVLPSRKEPFGIVILEAMATKKAVIAMDVGGVPEIVQDRKNGLLVKNHTPEALADSIVYLLKNPEFASKLGENGRKLVESGYTWEIIADRYLKVYQSVLKRRYNADEHSLDEI
jgi:hypothetical protein